jgi:hypothetical protein
MTVMAVDSTTSYFAGELVYTAAGDGTNRVYLSLINGNEDVPATATAWDATTTYFKNQSGDAQRRRLMSLIDLNLNQDPALAPALFNIATTYSAGNQVGGSDGVIYQSIAGGNLGHNPTTDNGVHWTNTGVLNPWTTVFVGGTGSVNWLQIGGAEFPMGVTLSPLNLNYHAGHRPLVAGHHPQRLPPAGRLPAQGRAGSQGGIELRARRAVERTYDDWEFQDRYHRLGAKQPDRAALRGRHGRRHHLRRHVLRGAGRAHRLRGVRGADAIQRQEAVDRRRLPEGDERGAHRQRDPGRQRGTAARRLHRLPGLSDGGRHFRPDQLSRRRMVPAHAGPVRPAGLPHRAQRLPQ